jgi:molybdate transport system substrate-binding protein
MAFKRTILSFTLLLLLLPACQEEERLRIVVANSVHPAAEELIRECPALDDEEVDLLFTSSGKAVAQIRDGAPYDLFMSADRHYPQALDRAGVTEHAPIDFAQGIPVLYGRDLDPSRWNGGKQALKASDAERIAVADPDISPFGRLSERILKEEGLFESWKEKRILGTGIAEVDRYARTGNVELALTSRSTAMEGEGAYIPFRGYRLDQAMVRIDRERSPSHQRALESFQRFVLSKEGRSILRAHGYGLPDPSNDSSDIQASDA